MKIFEIDFDVEITKSKVEKRIVLRFSEDVSMLIIDTFQALELLHNLDLCASGIHDVKSTSNIQPVFVGIYTAPAADFVVLFFLQPTRSITLNHKMTKTLADKLRAAIVVSSPVMSSQGAMN